MQVPLFRRMYSLLKYCVHITGPGEVFKIIFLVFTLEKRRRNMKVVEYETNCRHNQPASLCVVV